VIWKLYNDWPWPAFSNGQNPARWTAALLPPHRTYVEVCGGTALMAKPLGAVEVFNDFHGYAHTLFTVLRDPAQRRALLEAVEPMTAIIPMALIPLDAAQPQDPVEVARRFYFACRQSWTPDCSIRWLSRRRDGRVFTDAANVFNPVVERFHYAQMEDLPPAEIMTRYDSPRTCFVVDVAMLAPAAVAPVLATLGAIKGKALVLGTAATLVPEDWNVIAHGPQIAWANYTLQKRAA